MRTEKFSIKKRLMSFVYAFNGIKLLTNEHNVRIHIVATFVVISAGFLFEISTTEWLFVISAITMVFAAEAFNTAIEQLTDMAKTSYNEQAGRIKDIAAGAVLIVAIGAVVTGIIIFVPKIFLLFR